MDRNSDNPSCHSSMLEENGEKMCLYVHKFHYRVYKQPKPLPTPLMVSDIKVATSSCSS